MSNFVGDGLRRLAGRVDNFMFRGAAMRLKAEPGGLVAQVQGRNDETPADLLVLTIDGLGAYPQIGDGDVVPEGLVVQLENGQRVVLPFIDRTRFAGSGLDAPGTRSVWNDNARIRLLPDGTIEARGTKLDAKISGPASVESTRLDVTVSGPMNMQSAGQMTLSAPEIYANTSKLSVAGDVVDNISYGNAISMNQMRYVYDDHTHPENDQGGPTDPPNQRMGG